MSTPIPNVKNDPMATDVKIIVMDRLPAMPFTEADARMQSQRNFRKRILPIQLSRHGSIIDTNSRKARKARDERGLRSRPARKTFDHCVVSFGGKTIPAVQLAMK